MPDALAMPGLAWLAATTFAAGVVYGFAGFGAALIFMPVAVLFLSPEDAVAALSVSALASLVTVMPRAWRGAARRAALIMLAGACVTAPMGLWVLRNLDTTTLQWTISLTVALTLIALLRGWRVKTVPSPAARLGIGSATGLVGGATGLIGPVMVLFQLAGNDPVARSRANAVVFLALASASLLPFLALQGALSAGAVLLGAVLLVPYGAGARLGQALFRPERERLYRPVAHVVIALAVLAGMPICD